MHAVYVFGWIKVWLHVVSPSPFPWNAPSKFNIMPILSVKGIVAIGTMINFDGDFHGNEESNATCKASSHGLSTTAMLQSYRSEPHFVQM